MSKLRNLFVQAPALCGIDPDVAEDEGQANGRRFDRDVARGESSPYNRRKGQSSLERMKPATGAWESLVDEDDMAAMDTLDYLRSFFVLLDGKRAAAKGLLAEDELSELGHLEMMLREAEAGEPAVAAVLTIDEGIAIVQSNWA